MLCVLSSLSILCHVVNAGCGSYSLHSFGINTNRGHNHDKIVMNIHVNGGDWVGWSGFNTRECDDFEGGWDYFVDFADILPHRNIDGVAIYNDLNKHNKHGWNMSALKWNEPSNNGATKEIEINYFCKNILYDQTQKHLCGLDLHSTHLNATTCSPFYAYQNPKECPMLLIDVGSPPFAKQWNFEMPDDYDEFESDRHSVKAEYWVITCVIGLLGLITNGCILNKTMKHRKSRTVKFTTKHFQWWPLLCIVCGCIVGLTVLLKFFNGLCYFMEYIENIALFMQPTFMGFYQLYRLYYCFANKSIHSDKGYPIWLFIIMYIFAIITVIFVIIGRSLVATRSVCGINEYGQYYEQNYFTLKSLNVDIEGTNASIIWSVVTSLYLFWDIATLLLYSFKIRFIRKNEKRDINYKKILDILYTVVIPTLFYQIMGMLVYVIATILTFILRDRTLNKVQDKNCMLSIRYTLTAFLYVLVSIIYSYSIYLMLEDNNSEYIKFLKHLRDLKLNYICCCYRNMVIDAIEYNDIVNDDKKDTNDCKSYLDTLSNTNTHGISTNHGRIEMSVLSEPTTVKESLNNSNNMHS